MLAARDRGLGTVWTSFHLRWEAEAAEILGIPYDTMMQAALIPVAGYLLVQKQFRSKSLQTNTRAWFEMCLSRTMRNLDACQD